MVSIILFFLGRGIKAGYKLDDFMKQCLDSIGDNYIIKISILNSKHSLCFWKENNKIYTKNGTFAKRIKANLQITFKSKKSSKEVLLGEKSITTAFTEHSFIVYGDIGKAMMIIPLLEKIELYLFPKFISRSIVSRDVKKCVSSYRYYLYVLFSI